MNQRQLGLLIQDLAEGCIGSEELELLEQELMVNPNAHQQYMEHMVSHNLLQLESESNDAINRSVVPVERVLLRQKRRYFRVAAFAAAALVGHFLVHQYF